MSFTLSRASALMTTHGRIGCRCSVFVWDRRRLHVPSVLQVKHTKDDNRDIYEPLTRTAIRRLKVASLREELGKRGLDTDGTRPILVSRLLEALDKMPSTALKANNKRKMSETSPDDVHCPPLDPDRTYVLRIKGHSNMSHGTSGIGLVLYDASSVREVWVARKYFPYRKTPFAVDYEASILGLQNAYEHGARNIVLQTDNAVMLKQIKGEYKVSKQELQPLFVGLKDTMKDFSECDVTLISSAENMRAKNLAQRAVGTKRTLGLPDDDDSVAEESSFGRTKTGPLSESTSEETDEDSFEDAGTPIVISPDKTYLLQFDGGSRGNPGTAGSGMVLYDPDDMRELWCGWKYLGENSTNNAAEYNGLLLGIQCARSLGVQRLRAEGDSQLLVRHFTGRYKAKNPSLKELLDACREAARHLDFFEIRHILRDANRRADQLANQAMDTRESFGFDELE